MPDPVILDLQWMFITISGGVLKSEHGQTWLTCLPRTQATEARHSGCLIYVATGVKGHKGKMQPTL